MGPHWSLFLVEIPSKIWGVLQFILDSTWKNSPKLDPLWPFDSLPQKPLTHWFEAAFYNVPRNGKSSISIFQHNFYMDYIWNIRWSEIYPVMTLWCIQNFSKLDIAAGSMTSLFYRLYPKDAAIPDHTVTPAARWAKILANGGTLPEQEDDGAQTQEEMISGT